jgi:hypothetical protein
MVIGTDKPKVDWEKSPGHFEEWVNAIKGGPAAKSNFSDHSGPLTETVLLGNLAVWATGVEIKKSNLVEQVVLERVVGRKIEWDAKNLTAKNAPEVASIIKREYRKGYTL